ncbi:hypothetical protein [Microbacterium sp. NPDC055357]
MTLPFDPGARCGICPAVLSGVPHARPCGRRTVALQFTAVVAAPADDTVDLETPFVRPMVDLTDAIVSTLVWHTS